MRGYQLINNWPVRRQETTRWKRTPAETLSEPLRKKPRDEKSPENNVVILGEKKSGYANLLKTTEQAEQRAVSDTEKAPETSSVQAKEQQDPFVVKLEATGKNNKVHQGTDASKEVKLSGQSLDHLSLLSEACAAIRSPQNAGLSQGEVCNAPTVSSQDAKVVEKAGDQGLNEARSVHHGKTDFFNAAVVQVVGGNGKPNEGRGDTADNPYVSQNRRETNELLWAEKFERLK